MVLHRMAKLVPDHHGIFRVGHPYPANFQPAQEGVIEGVVLLPGIGIDGQGAAHQRWVAKGFHMALGQIQMVVAIDIEEGGLLVIQLEAIGIRAAKGGSFRRRAIHDPGAWAI